MVKVWREPCSLGIAVAGLMFSPADHALDAQQTAIGPAGTSPMQLGTWAVLEPAGPQNHAPQLCWLSPDHLGCVWMAGGQEGTSGMGIVLSTLRRGGRRWSRPRLISQDDERSEQNPLLFVSKTETGTTRLQLIHTAQQVRKTSDQPIDGSAFSMQWTAALRCQQRPQRGGRWSTARDLLDTPAFCRHPPHQRPDGRWLLPIYRSLEAGGAFGHDHSELLLLNADGSSTNELIPIPQSTGRVHGS